MTPEREPQASPTPDIEEEADTEDAVQLQPGEENEFELRDTEDASAHGVSPSKIEPTETQAALRFFVIDKDKGPIEGIVIKVTAPDGTKYYTEETDSKGYGEVLVPVGQKYELEFLSLGRRKIAAKMPVPDEPKQNIKLTLRYKRHDEPQGGRRHGFVLRGVHFDTGKATIRDESFPRLDRVVEFMRHKKSARIRIGGHTDNVGSPKANKTLSKRRAQAVRRYLISQGIAANRLEAVGYGASRPIASNDTKEGRQQNRRIDVVEL